MRALMTLNRYLLKYRWRLLAGVGFIVLSNLFAVLSPEVVKKAFDAVMAGLEVARTRNPQPVGTIDTLDRVLGWVGFNNAAAAQVPRRRSPASC